MTHKPNFNEEQAQKWQNIANGNDMNNDSYWQFSYKPNSGHSKLEKISWQQALLLRIKEMMNLGATRDHPLETIGNEQKYGSGMQQNFANYGEYFGCDTIDEFAELATRMLMRALRYDNANNTIIRLTKNLYSVDFDKKCRGLYNSHGKPLAFYAVDFENAGYEDAEHEYEAWCSNGRIVPSFMIK